MARTSKSNTDGRTDQIVFVEDVGNSDLGKGQVVLIPGARVPLWPMTLPKGLSGHAREQVARRQVDDRAGPGTKLDMRPFTIGSVRADTWDRALVVNPGDVINWKAAAPGAKALLPDYLAIPAAPGLWTVCCKPNGIRARLEPSDGFSAGLQVAHALLSQALATRPPRAVWQQGERVAEIDALFAARNIPVVTHESELSAHGIASPKIFGYGELAYDLSKDARMAHLRLRQQVLPWGWTALAATLACVIWAGVAHLETKRLQDAARAERQTAIELVRESFIPTGPILDVEAQVRAAVIGRQTIANGTGGAMRPLVLIATAATVLDSAGATTEEIRYDGASGLKIWVRVPDFAALDVLVAAFAAAQLDVEMRDARVAEDAPGVWAELEIIQAGRIPNDG